MQQGGHSRPLWFGPEDRPLFGWLHTPASGEARGGVVLCPTLGIEAVNARYASFPTVAAALGRGATDQISSARLRALEFGAGEKPAGAGRSIGGRFVT